MLNRITIMGRLTKDPELRRTQNGTAVTSFTVAVERDYNGEDGKKATDFIDCVAWRSSAEIVSKYFSKGRAIIVDGSLQSRKWQDKEGHNRTSWEVQAHSVYFGDSKPKQEEPSDINAVMDKYNQMTGGDYGGDGYAGYGGDEDDGKLPF